MEVVQKLPGKKETWLYSNIQLNIHLKANNDYSDWIYRFALGILARLLFLIKTHWSHVSDLGSKE